MNKARKINSGVWAGIVLFVGSIFLLNLSSKYSYSSEVGPGPGFFPMWLSGLLLVLSLCYLYESFKGKNRSDQSWPNKGSLKYIAFILVCLCLFVILASLTGFVVSSTVFLFLLFYKGYKWYLNVVLSIGISLCLFWLFYNVIGVLLPVNEFGF